MERAQRITPRMGHTYPSNLSSVTLKFYCRAGDLESAADIVRERELAPDVAVEYSNEEEMTAYARFLIARGEFGDADQVLARVLEIVRSGGSAQHEIHALALQALSRELLGERALALESLGRATMLGEPGRFNRTYGKLDVNSRTQALAKARHLGLV